MPETSIHELAIAEIERLSRNGFQRLSLPEPLESGFEQSTFVQRSARLWIEGLIAIAFFNIYVIADYFIRGGSAWFPLQVRLCIVTPVALLINLSMRWTPNKAYRETSVALASCLIGATHLYLESNTSATSSAYAQVGLIVTVIFVTVVMRLQFIYALCASLVLLASDLIFLRQDHFLNASEKLLGITLAVMFHLDDCSRQLQHRARRTSGISDASPQRDTEQRAILFECRAAKDFLHRQLDRTCQSILLRIAVRETMERGCRFGKLSLGHCD